MIYFEGYDDFFSVGQKGILENLLFFNDEVRFYKTIFIINENAQKSFDF